MIVLWQSANRPSPLWRRSDFANRVFGLTTHNREHPGQFCGQDLGGTLFVTVQPAMVKGSVIIDGLYSFSGGVFAELDQQTPVCPEAPGRPGFMTALAPADTHRGV